MPATRPYIPRILLAFDFDRTLAADSIDAVLALYGVPRARWEREFEEPLGHGWDAITRRGQALIDLGRAQGRPLGQGVLREAGEDLRLFDGAATLPARLGAVAREIHDAIRLELVVLSSGYAEIIAATEVARAFDRVLASAFHFDAQGRAVCVKRAVSHPEKALYLEALGKGVAVDGANAPEAAGRDVDEHERHVLFDQMVYAGDGASDLQAFGFLTAAGGLAVAIAKDGRFEDADVQRTDQRVDDLAPSDFSDGGETFEALSHAVRACAGRIALRALGKGE